MSRRPDNASAFHVVFDDLADETAGFGYSCSADGLNWEPAVMVPLSSGCRTPFGLVPMNATEIDRMREAILSFGVLGADKIMTIGTANSSSLQWLFRTRQEGAWEVFQTAIVQLVY